MINRELKLAQVVKKSDKDEYGQRHYTQDPPTYTFLTFGLYQHQQTDDIRYATCNYVGLTRDTTLTDNDYLIIEGKEYKIMFINPFGRMV